MANIKELMQVIKKANSWDEFKAMVLDLDPDKEIESDYKLKGEPLGELTEFNKKLKQALNWNPKDHK
jgi:hypothetical protein